MNTSTGVELALCLADLPSVWPRRCGVDMVLPYGSGLLTKEEYILRTPRMGGVTVTLMATITGSCRLSMYDLQPG